MLHSMTGFGRAEQAVGDKVFLVEVKSLNGKQFDIRITIPSLLKPYEFEIRNMLQEKLVRGSVECIITIKQNGSSRPVTINTELAKAYYQSISDLSTELNLDAAGILSALLKLPDVVTNSTEMLTPTEWEGFKEVLSNAIGLLKQHRAEEGKAMETDLLLRIENILLQQNIIAKLEPLRQQKIRDGLKKVLEENVGKESYDPNRLEQELIYYIEKIDISEEQVRLKNHCDYFRSILVEADESKGKKLSFIMQEIGREINTTGSKAYDSQIQKSVVLMKDELEKAKEQVLNIL
ncbi:YicC family protein [Segetibacter sp. 3557_3]|uniref:YicC/YloC family endoribonuclease n=1 Tax=Segetibacter sp. 3557_3 TaxID=2547429 RepID=UPI001058E151|nr:YicC/YloC family endoribonuclease [Segetibacter sp. 3557_3]TDH25132.1 YicC family protein [Segetibacter sp. 3557_3]